MARCAIALLLFALVADLSVTYANLPPGVYHFPGLKLPPGFHPPPGVIIFTDPHFVGFDGSKFDFHGYPNATFAILSDKAHQLNARFGTVAVVDGTYMHSIGLKHGRDEVEIRLVLDAENSYATDMQAFANGKQLEKGETVSLPDGTVVTLETDRVKPPSGHWAVIETELYRVKILNPLDRIATDDKPVWRGCLNIENFHMLSDVEGEMHGVLGQTYSAMLVQQGLQEASVDAQEAIGENPYEGKDADYAVSSLFSHDFKFTKYIGQVGARLERARRLLVGPAQVTAASVKSA